MNMSDATLTNAQIAQYKDKGYIVPDYRLPKSMLQKMRQQYETLLRDNAAIPADFMLGPHLTKPGSQGIRGSNAWLEFATNPDLMNMAAQLIGENIILWGTTIFGKPAKSGKETPWHQDGDYYPIRPLETLTIWIALDDVTLDNGPMRFIPGSHKGKNLYSHHWQKNPDLTINEVCDAKHFDASKSEDLLLEAGQVSFHDVYMIHGSSANHTEHRRAAFIVRLMPADCHYDHALGQEMGKKHAAHDYGYRPLFLVRGRDVSEKNDLLIGH
ncbi:MAG: phytanoyl-CoA dioxygenase family protein [Gammaproteobacteria bacterium]|nr:phytanoyl-CoA dioxygenase family protein [Gammaproteobacteria bacterium]